MEKELEIRYFVNMDEFRPNIVGKESIKPKLVERGYFHMANKDIEFRVSVINQSYANMGFKKHDHDFMFNHHLYSPLKADEWITKIPVEYGYELLNMCENKIYRISNSFQFAEEGFIVRIDRLLERYSGIVIAEIEIPYEGFIEPDEKILPGLYPIPITKAREYGYYHLACQNDNPQYIRELKLHYKAIANVK